MFRPDAHLIPLGLLLAAALWSGCGSPAAPPPSSSAPPPSAADTVPPPPASALIGAAPGTEPEIAARMSAANIAADSALRNGRPFLALVELERLEQSGLPDTYRAMVWVNIGHVRGQLGAHRAAVAAYDSAVMLERPLGRHYALALKGIYLAEKQYPDESIAVFEELLERRDLLPEERAAFEENIRVLRTAPRRVSPH